MLSSGKTPRREPDPSDFAAVGEILLPNALPMFRVDTREEHKRRKEQRDARVPKKPSTQGPGAKVNTSFFFTQFVTGGAGGEAEAAKKKNLREEDPREALLRVDALAKSDPMFLGNAYKDSQPAPLFLEQTFEEEQEEFKKKQKTLL